MHVFLYFNIWKHNLTRTLSRSSLQKQQVNNGWLDFYAKWLRCRLEVVSSNLTEVKTLSILSYFPFYKDLLVFRRIYLVSDNFSFSLLQQQSDFSRGGWSSAMVAFFFLFLLRAIIGETSAEMNVNNRQCYYEKQIDPYPYLLLGDSRFIEEHK